MRAYCNSCMRQTSHRILVEIVVWVDFDIDTLEKFQTTNQKEMEDYISEKYGEVSHEEECYADSYNIVECMGCNEVHFISSIYDGPYDPEPVIAYYPPRIARHFPKWLHDLDDTLGRLMKEIYAALHNDSRMLATMGARAAFERLMVLKVQDQGNFGANIDEFVTRGYLSPQSRDTLKQALDVGHATMHRGYVPTPEVISDVMDILEGLINAILVLPEKASKVQKVTPIRRVISGRKRDSK